MMDACRVFNFQKNTCLAAQLSDNDNDNDRDRDRDGDSDGV